MKKANPDATDKVSKVTVQQILYRPLSFISELYYHRIDDAYEYLLLLLMLTSLLEWTYT